MILLLIYFGKCTSWVDGLEFITAKIGQHAIKIDALCTHWELVANNFINTYGMSTVAARKAKSKRKKITKPFFVKTIKGEGMPIHQFPSEFGDLHVKFIVKMPKTLNDAQKKFVEENF